MYLYILYTLPGILFFNYVATILFFTIMGLSYFSLYALCVCFYIIIEIFNFVLFISNIILINLLNYKLNFVNILINNKIISKYKNINKFKKKIIKMNIDNTCPICLEIIDINNKLFIYPCAHSLCTKCYINFKKYNFKNCHICRNKIEYLKNKNEWDIEN